MKHYSTQVSSKNKVDLQEKRRTSGFVGPEKEVNGDGKFRRVGQKATPLLVSSVNGAEEETEQKIEPTKNIGATETQTDQPKSKDVLPDVSTEEYLKHKEETRAERKRQVQLKFECQM